MIDSRPLRSRLSSLLIALVALLLVSAGGDAIRSHAQAPTLTDTESTATFEEAVRTANSQSQLVDLATVLMEARADTEISFHTYQNGVSAFWTHQPDFYGNFFGDPYAATYDVEYFRMDRIRQLVGYEVDPVNGLAGLFACNPMNYDPAFQGVCRGFRYATADFFFLPTRPALATFAPDVASLTTPELASRDQTRDRSSAARSSRTSTANASAANSTAASDGQDAAVPADEIRIPDDVVTRMQERAWTLRRAAAEARLRAMIDRRYGEGHTLTPRQRVEIANEFVESRWSWTPDHEARQFSRDHVFDEPIPRRTFEEDRPRAERARQRSRAERSDARTRDRARAQNQRSEPPKRVRDAQEQIERSKTPSRESDDEGS